MRLRSIFSHITALIIGVFLAGFSTVLFAWTGPTASAPNSNIAAPLNVGTTAQVKNGDLGVNSFTGFGDAHLVSGWNPTPSTITYLNFSNAQYPATPTWGVNGYGIRDNNGTLEFKNSGNTWQSLSTIVQNYMALNGQWTTSGSNIYYNGGNVGIGTASPTVRLEVAPNTAIKLGNAYLSSGGDYVHLANNEWYNGSAWQPTAAGALFQIAGQIFNFYTHDASGNHTLVAAISSAGIRFPDGTTQASAATKGISGVTQASCPISSGSSCSVGCPGGYFVTGCSARSSGGSFDGAPSGNGCVCSGSGPFGGTCYAYCAK